MGNFFQKLFQKPTDDSERKQTGKMLRKGNGTSPGERKSSTKKTSQRKKSTGSVSAETVGSTSAATAVKQIVLAGEEVAPSRTNEESPFKRNFYPAPHEMLVPLEKYRPRRSNVRRSARNEKRRSNSLKESSLATNSYTRTISNDSQQSTDGADEEVNESISKSSENLDYQEKQQPVEKVLLEVPVVNVENNEEKKIDDSSLVDNMDLLERNKVARTRISEMFQRRQEKSFNNEKRKHQSAFEPYHNSQSYSMNGDESEENQIEKSTTRNKQFQIDSDQFKLVKSDSFERHLSNENNNNYPTEKISNDAEEPPSMVMRPKLTRQNCFANPLLIDELKKRQSHYVETLE